MIENSIEYNYDSRAVAVGNFNNDTWLDIVIANHTVNSIPVFLGYDAGNFSRSVIYTNRSHSTSYMVALGDFNNDHGLDIDVANFDSNSINIFLGFENGPFASQIETSTGTSRPL
jgi:hypothetical protein